MNRCDGRLRALVEAAAERFTGDVSELQGAAGMCALGPLLGWRVLVVIHSKRTVRKYEAILGIRVRDEFPAIGPMAGRSMGFRYASAAPNFWKVVSGEQPVVGRRVIG